MTQLAKTTSNSIAKDDVAYWTREQIDVIKNVICPGINDQQLAMFKEVCKRTGLDPFAKQIYVTIRPTWDANLQRKVDRMTIQTGIDGFRLIAERTGKYRGQRPFEWCGPDGRWTDVWLQNEPPMAARAAVRRADFDEPLLRVARYDAYVQTTKDNKPNSMWAKMHAEQLAKCAEALCLRTAFPQELSGLYTDDEMGQADNEPVRASVVSRAPANALPAANKPASVPPPAAASVRDGWPTPITPPCKFQWKASVEWNGKYLLDAPTDVLIEYSDYLAAVVHERKGTKAATQAAERLLEAEAEIALRLDDERKAEQLSRKGIDIGAALQNVIDDRTDDAKGSWLDPEAT